MSQYNTLKQAIQAVIRTNGNEEITGALLQQSLLSMVNSLGAGYQFMGVATPSTNPGTPDQKIFYIAVIPGTYANMGGVKLSETNLGIIKYDSSWSIDIINMPNNNLFNNIFGLRKDYVNDSLYYDGINTIGGAGWKRCKINISNFKSLIIRTNLFGAGNVCITNAENDVLFTEKETTFEPTIHEFVVDLSEYENPSFLYFSVYTQNINEDDIHIWGVNKNSYSDLNSRVDLNNILDIAGVYSKKTNTQLKNFPGQVVSALQWTNDFLGTDKVVGVIANVALCGSLSVAKRNLQSDTTEIIKSFPVNPGINLLFLDTPVSLSQNEIISIVQSEAGMLYYVTSNGVGLYQDVYIPGWEVSYNLLYLYDAEIVNKELAKIVNTNLKANIIDLTNKYMLGKIGIDKFPNDQRVQNDSYWVNNFVCSDIVRGVIMYAYKSGTITISKCTLPTMAVEPIANYEVNPGINYLIFNTPVLLNKNERIGITNAFDILYYVNQNGIGLVIDGIIYSGWEASYGLIIDAENSEYPIYEIISRNCGYPIGGLRWLAIGDSLTEINDQLGLTGNRLRKGYITRVCEKIKQLSYVNAGHSGQTFGAALNFTEIVAGYDIYSIMFGINDFYQNVPKGSISDFTNRTSGTILGNFGRLVQKIKNFTGQPKIVVFTEPGFGCSCGVSAGNIEYDSYTPNGNNEYYSDIMADIIRCCESEGIPYVDIYNESGITPKNAMSFARLRISGVDTNLRYPEMKSYLPFGTRPANYIYPIESMWCTYDGLHPSDVGMEIFAKLIIPKFVELLLS